MRLQSCGGPIISQALPKLEVCAHKKLERKIDPQQNQTFTWTLQRGFVLTLASWERAARTSLSCRGTAEWGRLVSHCWGSCLGSAVKNSGPRSRGNAPLQFPKGCPFWKGNRQMPPMQCAFYKKVYHEGIIKIQGTGFFQLLKPLESIKLKWEKELKLPLTFSKSSTRYPSESATADLRLDAWTARVWACDSVSSSLPKSYRVSHRFETN